MSRIQRTPENLFTIPKGAFVVNKRYVYINTSNKYVPAEKKKTPGGKGYTGHDSVCIGVLKDPEDRSCRMFYANTKFRERNSLDVLPDPPAVSDSIAIGLQCLIRRASEDSGLSEDLALVFGSEDAALVLDLASYMIARGSAVMQHFPAWARDNALFSKTIRSDSYIGTFLKSHLTIPKIASFRQEWLKRNIGSGYVYLCYDSTNVNSQAEGISIVQRGHAKDDPSLCQVNTDYVIRQEDGLPLTYLHSPGSVTDIAQAKEMIGVINETSRLTGVQVTLCLICDRGYISVRNLRHMDEVGISYLLMLRSDLRVYKDLAEQYLDQVRSYKNILDMPDGDERYGITVPCSLYPDGPECYAHIYWSASYYSMKRQSVVHTINAQRLELEAFIRKSQGHCFDEKELSNKFPPYFKLKLEPGEPQVTIQKKRGRGQGTKEVMKPTVVIAGYEDDEAAINREILKAGIIIMVSRDEMTAQQAEDRYHKRDCVEKAFEALKSHLGMDKLGVMTEEAIHGKGLIWFVASILYALMFNKTEKLRETDRKNYTTCAMVDQLIAIKADKDLSSQTYKRRYKLTKKQTSILNCFGVDEDYVDEQIRSVT